MEPLAQVSNASTTALAKADSKVQRAARQFEAVLLNSLLNSLEHSFSSLPGGKTESQSDHYHFLGIQALASSVAAKGGLGIADRIVRGLKKLEAPVVRPWDQNQKASREFLPGGLSETL